MSTVKDLKNLAKERGLRRYHNLKKAELLTLLERQIPPSKKDLKKLAKERGLRRYHNFKKAELLTLLERPIPAPEKKEEIFSKDQFQLREIYQFLLREQKERIF